MKLKALVAALALASGVAHADFNDFGAAGYGTLFFSAMNTATSQSFFLDTGLDRNLFSFANVGGVAAGYVGATETLQITWNFANNTVASTGAKDVSSLLSGVTGNSWSSEWAEYKSAAAGGVYDVFAGDRDNTVTSNSSAPVDQHYLSTSSTAESTVKLMTNTKLLNFNGINTWVQNQGVAQANGTHDAVGVSNGANAVGANEPAVLFQGANGGMKTNWNTQATFTSTGSASSQLDFYALDGVLGGGTLKPTVTNYNGKFAFDAANDTLTWTTAVAVTAVPEASTYAMLLAGLGLMGLMARRRTL